MSSKDDFTPQEWATLIKAPMMVSYAVMGAAPSGGIALVKEMKAVADAIVDSGEHAPAGSLIQAVVNEIKMSATDGSHGPKQTIQAGEIKGKAIELCQDVAQILQSKTTDEEAHG